jgi:hypothetical protein
MTATKRPKKLELDLGPSFFDDLYSGKTIIEAPLSHVRLDKTGPLPGNSQKRKRESVESTPSSAVTEKDSLSKDDKASLAKKHKDDDDDDETRTCQPDSPSCTSDYYMIHRSPSTDSNTQQGIEYGIDSEKSISFFCTMQPKKTCTTTTITKTTRTRRCTTKKTTTTTTTTIPRLPPKGKRRRRNNNNSNAETDDDNDDDADAASHIRENCKNAIKALSSHRKLHKCDCDFAYLDDRKRWTGSVVHKDDERTDDGFVVVSKPERACRKKWHTGWFVRQYMRLHDQYCACGCFGVKL